MQRIWNFKLLVISSPVSPLDTQSLYHEREEKKMRKPLIND